MNTILVVEDEYSLRKVITRSLIDAKFKVIELNNGEEVRDLEDKIVVDAIILDLSLPKISGQESLEMIRTNTEWKKNLPIIVLTNSESEADISLVKKYDAIYVHKVDARIEDVIESLKNEINNWSNNEQS